MAEAPLPVRPDLFVAAEPPRLVIGRCASCRRPHFPLADGCPYCGAESPSREEVPGRGRLWAWTAVTAAPPGYPGEVPYGFGVVELDAGLQVITRLTESDPARLGAGEPVHLVLEKIGDELLGYAFAPGDPS